VENVPNRPTAERLDELEARLAQQDQSILDLSDEIYRQQRTITELELQLRHVGERLRTMTVAEHQAGDPADEVPPHY
jgi:SlyX protein